jgi:D-arabinose 1-dehydrogenase-like Zn-dependent alcohol dehydrogenase
MKKLLLLGATLLSCAAILFAAPSGRTSLKGYQDVVILGSSRMGIYSVTLASDTATEIRPANTDRQGITILNDTGGSYSIYLATYAATSTADLWAVADTATYTDEIEAYTGAIYGLGSAGISTSTVKVIEKW